MTLTSLSNDRSGNALKNARKATVANTYLSRIGLTRIEAKMKTAKMRAKVRPCELLTELIIFIEREIADNTMTTFGVICMRRFVQTCGNFIDRHLVRLITSLLL